MDAQEQYFRLVEQRIEAERKLEAVNQQLLVFGRAHKGKSFYVFRPEDVLAMLRDDVKPLWPI